MTGISRAQWRKLRPLAVVLLIAVAVPPVASLVAGDHHTAHVYKKRSVNGRRALNLTYERDYQYEATFEKCEIQDIDALAAGLGVQPTPDAVARAYSLKHAASIRSVVYRGCRDAFTGAWSPPPAQ
jgi:hypothetical protein